MGKRSKIPGLPKEGAKRQREQIATRALLLGGRYDKATSMIIVETTTDNGPGLLPSWWHEYYDVEGRQLSQKEGRERQKQAQRRYRGGNGFVPTVGQKLDTQKYRDMYSKSFAPVIWSKKLEEKFKKGTVFSGLLNNEPPEVPTPMTATSIMIKQHQAEARISDAADALRYSIDNEIMDKLMEKAINSIITSEVT